MKTCKQQKDGAQTQLNAANELFKKNIPLVTFAYRKYFNGIEKQHVDDLLQEGYLALWKACLSYDESKNVTFSTYAITLILCTFRKFNLQCTGIGHALKNPKALICSLNDSLSEDSSSTFQDQLEYEEDNCEYDNDEQQLVEILGFISYWCEKHVTQNKIATRDVLEEYAISVYEGERVRQSYLANKYKIARSTISKTIRRFGKDFTKYVDGTYDYDESQTKI